MKKFFGIFMIICSNCLAWGKLGHQITAKIAEVHLTAASKHKLKLILGNSNLVTISDWLDQIRPTRKYLKLHYTTMDDNYNLHESKRNGLLYQGLKQAIETLKSDDKDINEQKLALKIIVHIVGDAHQPLHVGNGQDAGGNLCFVKWFKRKRVVPLHKVWDNFLVQATYRQNPWIVADSLAIAPNIKDNWRHASIFEWLKESRQLHKIIYPESCQKSQPSHLSNDYLIANAKITKTRLEQGGIRLAHILNQCLDPKNDA